MSSIWASNWMHRASWGPGKIDKIDAWGPLGWGTNLIERMGMLWANPGWLLMPLKSILPKQCDGGCWLKSYRIHEVLKNPGHEQFASQDPDVLHCKCLERNHHRSVNRAWEEQLPSKCWNAPNAEMKTEGLPLGTPACSRVQNTQRTANAQLARTGQIHHAVFSFAIWLVHLTSAASFGALASIILASSRPQPLWAWTRRIPRYL